jgi:hypothetical protein
MSDVQLPTDQFSRRLRELTSNPGAVRASSTISTVDFYGNAESWIVDTFRVDGDDETLLQRINAAGSVRLVIPPAVMNAIVRGRERATTKIRKRAAHTAIETRRRRGDQLGNPEALAKARKAPRKPRRRRRKVHGIAKASRITIETTKGGRS